MNKGKTRRIEANANTNPPIIPAAKGNPKTSLLASIINGIKPNVVEAMVKRIGRIFTLQAFT
ncbi:MAG TPA: hypothetical protein VK152_06555 [Paludibacter sp.]|nr:hypothetical protein [Paludibacter sp.]